MIKKNLKDVIKSINVYAEEKPKKDKEEKPKKEYTSLITPLVLDIADKAKLVFSASSTGEDKPVHVDIRTYIVNPDETKYSGPTQKGVNFDVEYLDEFIEILKSVSKELAKKNK